MAVDLSGWSKATVIHAAGIADLFGAAVTLIHVFDPEGITKIAGDRVYDSLDDARRDAEKRLSGLVEEIRKFYPECDMEFRIGEPSEQIKMAALLLNADLVVIASHHPASPLLFFAADQAQEISRNLSCPVLVYNGTGTAGDAARKTATDGWFRTIPGELSASPEAKVPVHAENENKTAKEKSNTCDNP